MIPIPDSNKVHGANTGPIWGRQDPGGPHVAPMNLAIWDNTHGTSFDDKDRLRVGRGLIITSIVFLLWDVITHPCPNSNGGAVKPPLKLGMDE